ncbi:MAG: TSUP family transporter [Planctomycetota bacterium]|jgi:uncharacterized membrane protein YfcA
MDYVIVCSSAFLIALMTLFSGFGLGTLLMPVFAVFFPVEVAVAATAVVHLANNVFKIILVGRHADWRVAVKFGVPAILGALAGATLLGFISELPEIATYAWGGRRCDVTVVKLLIAVLIIVFSALDVLPALKRLSINRRFLPWGGALSGFFGGLSGHQGALRSAFLIKLGLTSQAFIGTGVVAAVMVDVTRIGVYGAHFATKGFGAQTGDPRLVRLVAAATLAAFAGSFLAALALKKVTIDVLRTFIGLLLMILAVALAAGVI